jgi:hypothetical protein
MAVDGTLFASGCNERLLTVSDPARPQLGPLVQVCREARHRLHMLARLQLACALMSVNIGLV